MLNVLVVEDEYYARKLIVKLVKKLSDNLNVSGDVETGKDAVEFMKSHIVDIVITDIEMPEMDGLELAEYIHKNKVNTKTIIVSGYSEFEYARKALKFGVKDYITKPIQEKELITTLNKIIQEDSSKDEDTILIEDLLMKSKELQFFDVRTAVENDNLRDTIFNKSLHLFEKNIFQVILIQSKQTLSQEAVDDYMNNIKSICKDAVFELLYFKVRNEFLLIIFANDKINRYIDKILFDIDLLFNNINKEDKITFTAGLSRIYSKKDDLIEAYKDCIYAINGRLLKNKNIIYDYQKPRTYNSMIAKEYVMNIVEYINNSNYKKAKHSVSEILDICMEQNVDVYTLYSIIVDLLNEINKLNSIRAKQNGNEKAQRVLSFSIENDLYQFWNIEQLEEYLLKIIEFMCGKKEKHIKNDIINEIIDYISINYAQDITLSQLASNKYFVDTSYLSRLFKNATGENFSKYLIGYRLQKAKELLANTELKVSDVGSFVGYNDSSHFIQAFKKRYEITPEMFRILEKEGK